MAIDISVPTAPAFTPRVAVVGLGGGGCNAVDNMIETGIEGVDFIVCNTDAQALQRSRCENKVQLGVQATRGLGAGTDPAVGCAAAEESIDEVMDAVGEANMLFVVAGMGGGTGTGAAPVVARAAREAGILTVAVVTRPFVFEAEVRAETAQAGISKLREVVDSYIVIANQNLFKVTDEATSIVDSFRLADGVLCAGVRGVTDLIMKPGVVNVDFADVRATLKETGPAIMGTGEGEGENRVQTATSSAINNPLLDDIPTDRAQGLLVNITAAQPALAEVERIIDMIRERTHRRVNLIFGTAIDESMGDRLRVSVMMTGLDTDGAAGARLPLEGAMPAALEPAPCGSRDDAGFPLFDDRPAGNGADSSDAGHAGNGHFPDGLANGHGAEAAFEPTLDPAGSEGAEPAPADFEGGLLESSAGEAGPAVPQPVAALAGADGGAGPTEPPSEDASGRAAAGPARSPGPAGPLPSGSAVEVVSESGEVVEFSPALSGAPAEDAGGSPAGIVEPDAPLPVDAGTERAAEPVAEEERPVEPALTENPAAGTSAGAGDPVAGAAPDSRKSSLLGRILDLTRDSSDSRIVRKEPSVAGLKGSGTASRARQRAGPVLQSVGEPAPAPALKPAEFPLAQPGSAEMAPGEARVTLSGDPDVFQIPSFLRRQ